MYREQKLHASAFAWSKIIKNFSIYHNHKDRFTLRTKLRIEKSIDVIVFPRAMRVIEGQHRVLPAYVV